MAQKDEILELLDDIKPKALCDDCLSAELSIHPRQAVNLVCRGLNASKAITRIKTECDRCGVAKIVNGFVTGPIRASAPTQLKSRARIVKGGTANVGVSFDVEKARTDIVRICRALWREQSEGEPSRGLAALINQLRNEAVLPNHQANMMLTICNLRNIHVYEGFELTSRELTIAIQAKTIIDEWWVERK